jgi:glycosyltransferase involved in cell wall biosynthesis
MAVYLHTSHIEGWPLPPAEAMACGAALVASANQGVREYAEDGVTALLSPPADPALLADRLATLLGDDALRVHLAAAGAERIAGYSWDTAVDRMERALSGTAIRLR